MDELLDSFSDEVTDADFADQAPAADPAPVDATIIDRAQALSMYKWLCTLRQFLQGADQRLRLFLEGRRLEELAWECNRCGSRWTREEWAKRCPVCHSSDWALPTAQVMGEEEELSPIPQPRPANLLKVRPPRGRPKGAKDAKPRKRRTMQERAASLPIDTYESQPQVEYFARHDKQTVEQTVERPVKDVVPEEVIGGVALEGEVPSPQARVRVGGQRDLSAEIGLTRSPDVATIPRMPTPPPGLGGPPPPPGLRKSLSEQLAERSKDPADA